MRKLPQTEQTCARVRAVTTGARGKAAAEEGGRTWEVEKAVTAAATAAMEAAAVVARAATVAAKAVAWAVVAPPPTAPAPPHVCARVPPLPSAVAHLSAVLVPPLVLRAPIRATRHQQTR
jgi:hypothetical protein